MTTLLVTIQGKQSAVILQSDKVNDNLHVITSGNKKARAFKPQPVYAFLCGFIIHQNNVLIIQQMPYHDVLRHVPFHELYHELHLS